MQSLATLEEKQREASRHRAGACNEGVGRQVVADGSHWKPRHPQQATGGWRSQTGQQECGVLCLSSGRSVATKYYSSGDLVIIHSISGHILVAVQHRYDGKWDGNGSASQCWDSATFKFWMGGAGLLFPSSKPLMCASCRPWCRTPSTI